MAAPEGPKTAAPEESRIVKKLVLCFDGTGNTFAGNNGDTNIVKLYHKFDRENDDNQYHYYQPGIGTYDINSASVNKSFLGNIQSSISQTLDSGFGTSFDAHVIAGYRFIMRYYDSGDKIYIFGFSRGAFTARFLARMVNKIGILSKGNEEMVPFAYKLYQDYETGKVTHNGEDAHAERINNATQTEDENLSRSVNDTERYANVEDEIQMERDPIIAFKHTFCRRNKIDPTKPRTGRNQHDIKVHFLGMFDCVSSVSVLENPFARTSEPVKVGGTAHFVRHAVAADEFRVKFKAALLDQDLVNPENHKESGKEVWFPGNHGDIGGGWPVLPAPTGWWDRVSRVLFGHQLKKPEKKTPADPASKKSEPKPEPAPYQMSDIPLAWMIRELDAVEKLEKNEKNQLKWNPQKEVFMSHFKTEAIKLNQAVNAAAHDTLSFGKGTGLLKVLFWNLLEILPFVPRWELQGRKWKRERVLPNFRGSRDIPIDAVLHQSLISRLKGNKLYEPQNNHGDREAGCLKKTDPDGLIKFQEADDDVNHILWTFEGQKVWEGDKVEGEETANKSTDVQTNDVAKESTDVQTNSVTPPWSIEAQPGSTGPVSKTGATVVVTPVKTAAVVA